MSTPIPYVPGVSGAQGDGFLLNPLTWTDNQQFNIHDPSRWDAAWGVFPTQSEIDGLINGSVSDINYRSAPLSCPSTINVGDPVYITGADSVALATSASTATLPVIGFVRYVIGSPVTNCIVTHFFRNTNLYGLTPNGPIYLTDTGSYSQSRGTVSTPVGTALSTTEMLLFAAPGAVGISGFSGLVGTSGFSGANGGSSGTSGYSGASGVMGAPGGTSGYSGFSGIGLYGTSGFSGAGQSGASGAPGIDGDSGLSGFSGLSGQSGTSGRSGFSGWTGFSGKVGASGKSGTSGLSGFHGQSGFSGVGVHGASGVSGTGASGKSGFSGPSGTKGYSGTSGFSGLGIQGSSGVSGAVGSGVSGFSGAVGSQGFSGSSGVSGFSGTYSGYSGTSGLQGIQGLSGVSGFSGSSPVAYDAENFTLIGCPLVQGIAGQFVLGYNATLVGVMLESMQTGSIAVDIWRSNYGAYPPGPGNSITGYTPPTIVSGTKYLDASLLGWTTSLNRMDTLRIYVSSAVAINNCTLTLLLART